MVIIFQLTNMNLWILCINVNNLPTRSGLINHLAFIVSFFSNDQVIDQELLSHADSHPLQKTSKNKDSSSPCTHLPPGLCTQLHVSLLE